MKKEEEKQIWLPHEGEDWNRKLEEWWPQHERNKAIIEKHIFHGISRDDYLEEMRNDPIIKNAMTSAQLTDAAIDYDLNMGDGRMCLEWGVWVLDNGKTAWPDSIHELDNQIAYDMNR